MSNEKSSINKGYEISDTKFKPIFFAGVGLLVLIAIGMLAMLFLFGAFDRMSEDKKKPASPLAQERQLPEGLRLQVDPDGDWLIFKAEQDSIISSYGWISKEAGVVKVPIEKAMEISLKKGFPVRAEVQGDK